MDQRAFSVGKQSLMRVLLFKLDSPSLFVSSGSPFKTCPSSWSRNRDDVKRARFEWVDYQGINPEIWASVGTVIWQAGAGGAPAYCPIRALEQSSLGRRIKGV